MKVLFLSSGRHVPSSRFRIQAYVDSFRRDGHHCVVAHSFPQKYDYFPWMGFRPSQLLKRSVRWWHWLQARMRRFDIVYIEREIFDSPSSQMEERFRAVCSKMVVDIDDAVFMRYPEKFQTMLPMFDLVVCGNRLIADFVDVHNSNVLLIPTSIDTNLYSERLQHRQSATPIVGWMGTTGNLQYLDVAAEALRAVAEDIPFRLRLIVPELSPLAELDLTGVCIEHRPWTASREVAELQEMDVGLMPLAMNQQWAQYKCGAKLLQYLAVGVPGIATPIGVNAEILAGNRVGFSASTSEEWTFGLRTLLSDASLREAMGQAGRELVCRNYSIQSSYPKLMGALQELVSRR